MGAWRGFFISFEGLDGAGKSTQVASLAGALRQQGHDVVTVRPDETPSRRDPAQLRAPAPARSGARGLGRGAPLHRRARAVAARDHPARASPWGSRGIADRYADSTIAYQGGGRGIPTERPASAARRRMWRRLARPDPLPGDTRRRPRPSGSAPSSFHSTASRSRLRRSTPPSRRAFEQLAAQHPRRFVRIDATRPAIIVSRDVEKVIVQRLPAPAPSSPPIRNPEASSRAPTAARRSADPSTT